MGTSPDFFCSELTYQSGLQLFGTAPRGDVWFLLEYDKPWGNKAFEESTLSDDFKTHFKNATSAVPNSKLQMIKRGHSGNQKYLFIALCNSAALLKIPFSDYEELLQYNFAELIKSDEFLKEYETDEPLIAVCTNGKRDKCCAKFGLELFKNFQNYFDENVWQTSHIGGHRFAPTFVYLPYGIIYGFAQEESVLKIAQDISNNKITRENYRGRSNYSKYSQAAEYFLMEKTGERDIHAFEVFKREEQVNGNWEVSFKKVSGEVFTVSLREEDSGISGFASCGDTKLVMTKNFVLEGIV